MNDEFIGKIYKDIDKESKRIRNIKLPEVRLKKMPTLSVAEPAPKASLARRGYRWAKRVAKRAAKKVLRRK